MGGEGAGGCGTEVGSKRGAPAFSPVFDAEVGRGGAAEDGAHFEGEGVGGCESAGEQAGRGGVTAVTA